MIVGDRAIVNPQLMSCSAPGDTFLFLFLGDVSDDILREEKVVEGTPTRLNTVDVVDEKQEKIPGDTFTGSVRIFGLYSTKLQGTTHSQ